MLKAVIPAGVPRTAVYRTYSAVTHGEFYGLMNFMAPGVSSDGTSLLHWHLPVDVLESTIQMAIAGFREPWERISKVMGWGKLEGDLWEIKLSKIYTRPGDLGRTRSSNEACSQPSSPVAFRAWRASVRSTRNLYQRTGASKA